MKGRFLLPTVLLLTVAALIFFLLFVSSYDVPQQQIEKQKPADTKTSQRSSARSISTDMAQSDLDLPSRIRSLFDDLPKLNEREQEKCAEEIAEQSDDSTAVEWSKKLISNSIPQAAVRVLFNDLLNRPPEVLHPFLAEIADQLEHPLKEESTESLEFLYDRPPAGINWNRWVKEKLAED
jgi:hypothetical protein